MATCSSLTLTKESTKSRGYKSPPPQVIPHGVRCEGLLRVLLWVSFDLPEHLKTTLSALLVAAGEGNMELQNIPIGGRDIRDGQPDTEADLQAVLIAMIPTPGGSHDEGGLLVRNLFFSVQRLRGFRQVVTQAFTCRKLN